MVELLIPRRPCVVRWLLGQPITPRVIAVAEQPLAIPRKRCGASNRHHSHLEAARVVPTVLAAALPAPQLPRSIPRRPCGANSREIRLRLVEQAEALTRLR